MMPIMFLPFLLFSAIFTAEAQQGQSIIKPGSFLTPTTNSSWVSHSGLYAFGFYKQGNGYAVGIFLAGLPQKTVVWTADRDKPPVPADAKLTFTSDGRLVLQGTENRLANFPAGASSASMLESGNFVLYNSANQTVWQSFEYPTDTFLPSQNLSHGQVLNSSVSYSNQATGIFRLIMQEDGYLAMYPAGTPYTLEYGYWGGGTPGQKNDVVLQLDDDGHLYSVNGSGKIVVDLAPGGDPTAVYRLTIDPDGILRLYSHNKNQNGNWTVKWYVPEDKCAPKGLCGLNGYCDLNAQDHVVCNCLPGFVLVNQDDRSSGCETNFTAEGCTSKLSNKYAMEEVPNTVWENSSYSILMSTTQENCTEACLQDCNCEAALFKDGECTKRKLPLRFGRRNQNDTTVALIKVGKSTPTIDRNQTESSAARSAHKRTSPLLSLASLLPITAIYILVIASPTST